MNASGRSRGFTLWLGSCAAVALALFLLPPFSLLVSASPSELARGLSHPSVRPALLLSLLTTTLSLALTVAIGTPLAWSMSRRDSGLTRGLETLLQLPVVMPPAVAGVALLLAFGRRGVFGRLLPDDLALGFTPAAVVIAQLFVAGPLFVQAALAALRRVDDELLLVGRTLGALPSQLLFRIALPIAMPGLLSGAALCWARALGEFGATLMFAGNLAGSTQTMPLAVYDALESDLGAARALSLVLMAVALCLLLFANAMTRRAARD